jgi:hypothetical protein
MKTINSINGIPLHYARTTNHLYGTRGEDRSFQIDGIFNSKLEEAFLEVFNHCPLGAPDVMTTAGIFVNKPGQHGYGKAFDLDALFWSRETLVTLDFIHKKELYLGIESFLRKHFGIVLNHLYPNHADHWHIDTSVPVDFDTTSKSETLYVQMALKYIYAKDVIMDGVWGRQTSGFMNEVFARLGINTPITTKVNYLKFLDLTGKIAFKLTEDSLTPLRLLANLGEVIETLPLDNKLKVREALNSFTDDNRTATWLSGFTADTHDDLDNIITAVLV